MKQVGIALRLESGQAINGLKKVDEQAKKFNGTINQQGSKLKVLQGGLKSASTGVKSFGGAIKTALPIIGLVTTTIGALTAGFNILKEQDFAEAKFRALGGNSVALKKNIEALSGELNGQADILELTKASYDVASAGFTNAADAAKILKAASLGATGGFTDINTSGGAAVKVLNAYGKTADDAAFLMDQFAQTQADGIITIGQYSNNIGKVATTAAGLKIPLAEVNAVIAQSTAAGSQTETAFTGLNAALAKISSGQAGKKLGIDMNEATLAADGLGGTLEKLSDFSTAELQQAFGLEAFKGISVAIQDTEKFNKLLENQKNAQGAAAQAAFVAADTVEGQIKKLQTAFVNLFARQSAFGTGLKNILKVAVVTVQGITAAFNVVFGVIEGVANAVGTVLRAFGILKGDGVSQMMELEKAWNRVLTGFQYTAAFVAEAGNSIGRFLTWGIENIIKFKDAVFKVFQNIKTGIENTFKLAFQNAVKNFTAFFDALPPWVKNFITGKFEDAKDWAASNLDTLKQGAQNVSDALAGPMENAKNLFTPLQVTVAKEIEIINKNIADNTLTQSEGQEKINKLLKDANGNLLPSINNQTDTMKDAFSGIAETVTKDMAEGLKGLIKGTQTLGETLSGIAGKMSDMLLDMGIKAAFGGLGLPGFASGGRPPVGKPAIVGEKGPELFVPRQAGSIIPNNELGGGGSTNVTVNVDATGGSAVQGDAGQAEQLGMAISQAIQSELMKQKRPGGLLYA